MAVKLELTNGDEVIVRGVGLGDINRAFALAYERGVAFEIRNANGEILPIDPHEVRSLERIPDEPSVSTTRQAVPAS